MSQWRVSAKRADFKAIAKRYNIDPVTARLLVNRNIPEDEMGDFLHPDLKDLHDPEMMRGMVLAARLLLGAVRNSEKIRVFGDYDADGIFSTYILTDGLKKIGGNVSWQIPDRIKDGYGLNTLMVEKAADDGINVVLTCDNGIAAMDAVARAKELGMTVIVTDHHEIPFETCGKDRMYPQTFDTGHGIYDMEKDGRLFHIPHADCVVDPHRPDDRYPYKEICGAVVAFKLIQEIYRIAGQYEAFDIHAEDYMKYLPEAAFATITDVMELKDENRTIVFHGLRKIASGDTAYANTGLDSLIKETGIDRARIGSYHIGFVLGPAFNAAGRLASADLGEELLMEKDPEIASGLAKKLIELNNKRKSMTEAGMKTAEKMLSVKKKMDKVIVLAVPGLHESLCGLVAGRLKEKYHRPAFVFSDSPEHIFLKGSGRSIEKYSMYDKISEADRIHKETCGGADLFNGYGGHPMAAGLSVRRDCLEWFTRCINDNCGLEEKDLEDNVLIDVPMPLWYVNERLVDEIGRLEPFGTGNEKPLFADRGVSLKSYRMIGKEKQYRKMTLVSKGRAVDAVYFGDGNKIDGMIEHVFGGEELKKALDGKENDIVLDVTYYPEINEYMGRRSVQAMVQNIRTRKD
ncbi:MAG: DHH family phosphoesterase [Candidatus Weimeria sp.]